MVLYVVTHIFASQALLGPQERVDLLPEDDARRAAGTPGADALRASAGPALA